MPTLCVMSSDVESAVLAVHKVIEVGFDFVWASRPRTSRVGLKYGDLEIVF